MRLDKTLLQPVANYHGGQGTVQTGLAMLRWLAHGVQGAEEIRDLLRENEVENPHRALGEALFNVEGGRIRGELIYGPLCHFEQKYMPISTACHSMHGCTCRV
jgi:hypothetical protein